jgi:hypothetical protein
MFRFGFAFDLGTDFFRALSLRTGGQKPGARRFLPYMTFLSAVRQRKMS